VGWRLRSWNFRFRLVVRGIRGDAILDMIPNYNNARLYIIPRIGCDCERFRTQLSCCKTVQYRSAKDLRGIATCKTFRRTSYVFLRYPPYTLSHSTFPATLEMGTGSSGLISALVTWGSPLHFSTRPATMRGKPSRSCHVSNPSPLSKLSLACSIQFSHTLEYFTVVISFQSSRLVIKSTRAGNSVVECRTAALQSNLPEVTGSTPVRPLFFCCFAVLFLPQLVHDAERFFSFWHCALHFTFTLTTHQKHCDIKRLRMLLVGLFVRSLANWLRYYFNVVIHSRHIALTAH
jgi:hypothetical protein